MFLKVAVPLAVAPDLLADLLSHFQPITNVSELTEAAVADEVEPLYLKVPVKENVQAFLLAAL